MIWKYVCGLSGTDVLGNRDLLDVYRGAVCEQFVGQELLASGGSQNGRLFYWSRQKKNSNAEVDYLFVRNGAIHPLEVKSGTTGKLKSLQVFLKEHDSVKKAYVFNSGNIGDVQHIHFRPFYTAFPTSP